MLLDVKGHPIPFASPSSPKTHIPDGLGCPIEGFHLNCVSSSIPSLYTKPFSLLPPRSSARALFPPLQGPLCPSAPPGGAGMWLKVLPGPYCLCTAAARWNRPTGTARRPRRLSLSPSRYRRSRRNTAGTPRTSPCGSPRRRLPWSSWRFCPRRKCREKVPEGKTPPLASKRPSERGRRARSRRGLH